MSLHSSNPGGSERKPAEAPAEPSLITAGTPTAKWSLEPQSLTIEDGLSTDHLHCEIHNLRSPHTVLYQEPHTSTMKSLLPTRRKPSPAALIKYDDLKPGHGLFSRLPTELSLAVFTHFSAAADVLLALNVCRT